MEQFFLPSKISINKGEGPNQGELVVEPLFYGYGTTMGNAIRRVLLSSLEGGAAIAVKIKGVNHEFESVEGVYEDVLQIILNLKQLNVRVHSNEPVKIKLKVKGEKEITAKDFETSSDVEIINKDLPIAKIVDKNKELDMEVLVAKGMGFVPTEEMDKSNLEVGMIAIDAIYTPVKKVGYQVENTRVGQITDYDKLTLSVETDGTLTPEEALSRSLKILIDHFQLVLTSVSKDAPAAPAVKEEASVEEDEAKTKKTTKKTVKKK